MITVYRNVRGVVKRGSPEDIHPLHKLLWVSAVDITPNEADELERKTRIPRHFFLEGLDEYEVPRVTFADQIARIIFKSPKMDHERGWVPSFSILFTPDYIITVSKQHHPALDKLERAIQKDGDKGEVFIDSPDLFVYEIIKHVMREFSVVLDQVEEDIDTIEDQLLRRPKQSVVQHIFKIKKTLIYFHKALAANVEVIATLDRGQIPLVSKKNLPWFRELYYDINQLIDMEATYRDVVTGTLDLYISTISNSINETMKKLTVVASFVLIPTLISGIYGMNFHFMPELEWKFGYPFALGLMAVSILFIYAYFKMKDWM
ncbi:magnesium/cobalt transporter CorA [Candidatus Woesearchaeota archaeon]|nr:magnesium/cobalt transporter CorA [Candidatus Woesearchaeota archaeon]